MQLVAGLQLDPGHLAVGEEERRHAERRQPRGGLGDHLAGAPGVGVEAGPRWASSGWRVWPVISPACAGGDEVAGPGPGPPRSGPSRSVDRLRATPARARQVRRTSTAATRATRITSRTVAQADVEDDAAGRVRRGDGPGGRRRGAGGGGRRRARGAAATRRGDRRGGRPAGTPGNGERTPGRPGPRARPASLRRLDVWSRRPAGPAGSRRPGAGRGGCRPGCGGRSRRVRGSSRWPGSTRTGAWSGSGVDGAARPRATARRCSSSRIAAAARGSHATRPSRLPGR